MATNPGAEAGKMNRTDFVKLGKGLLIAAAGVGATYLEEQIPGLDFGPWAPIVAGVNSVLVNFLRKLVASGTGD